MPQESVHVLRRAEEEGEETVALLAPAKAEKDFGNVANKQQVDPVCRKRREELLQERLFLQKGFTCRPRAQDFAGKEGEAVAAVFVRAVGWELGDEGQQSAELPGLETG